MSEPPASRTGTLYLVPTLLGASAADAVLPEQVLERVRGLPAFIAESAKSARYFLKAIGYPRVLAQTPIQELNEHTAAARLPHSQLPPADHCPPAPDR